jgi:hypothetical protein
MSMAGKDWSSTSKLVQVRKTPFLVFCSYLPQNLSTSPTLKTTETLYNTEGGTGVDRSCLQMAT